MNSVQAPSVALFSLGRVSGTPGAVDALKEANQPAIIFLRRHIKGDWGDCCEEDAAANDYALKAEGRIFSVYHTAQGEKIWIITEWDRSYTTILLPSEY